MDTNSVDEVVFDEFHFIVEIIFPDGDVYQSPGQATLEIAKQLRDARVEELEEEAEKCLIRILCARTLVTLVETNGE